MSRRSEIGSALIWFAFGAAIAVASWRMDRLDHLGINPWSVPGLTPGAIGVLIMLFALALGWQAWAEAGDSKAEAPAEPSDADTDAGAAPAEGTARRTLVACLLCVLFAGLTLGRGVPFVVEGSVFVFVFTSLFSWSSWRAEGRVGRGLARTLVIAVVACVLISWLFERVFLVRLP